MSVVPLPRTVNHLAEAEEHARKYEWTKSAEAFQRAIERLGIKNNPSEIFNAQELLARSWFKAAFQSSTRKEFQQLMGFSGKSYQDLVELYKSSGFDALSKRAEARALFASFWAQDELEKKLALREKFIPLAEESARVFEVNADRKNLAETLLDLLSYREAAVHLSRDRRELVDLFESALETAWRIIEEKDLAEDQDQLEAINILSQLYLMGDYALEKPRYEELERRLSKLGDTITQLSEKTLTVSSEALASEAAMNLACDLEQNIPKTLTLFEKASASAKTIRDHYMIGRLNEVAAAVARWAGLSEEYVEKRREQLDRAIGLADRAIESLQPSSPGAWLKRSYGVKIDSSYYLTLAVETDPDKKRADLREAIKTSRKGMMYEQYSFMTGVGHQLSRSMYLLSTMGIGTEEKRHLLTEALSIREGIVRSFELLSPHSWSHGLLLNYLALTKTELSKIETDPAKKLELLKGASTDMELCVKLCGNLAGIHEAAPGKVRMLAQFNEWHGDVLNELYDNTLEPSKGREAIDSFRQSISYLSRSGNIGPIPPLHWKIAQTHDLLKEYTDSSESFRQAAQEYRLAGKKIAGLSEVFEDYAQYMEAWAVIEEARLKHEQEQYATSAETYAKVASLLRTQKKWNHLSKHYSGCSFLEHGEGMSRQERQQAALESFNAAKTNLHGAVSELEEKLSRSQPQEKQELTNWLDITNGRMKYALARIQLEEAKVLDARMEEEASSAKYKQASDSFRKLLAETHHKPTRDELETLGIICDAWAKMKSAEASTSPELYSQASEAFQQAESKTSSKKTRLAARATASMCKALESGCEFRRTRNRQLYEKIKTNLETAADFYEEAGIKKAADWTRATQRYFDALTYLRDAEVETEPKKRTELFHLAENHLQLAATIYGEAGYPSKKQESLRHLERAREEKRLLLMPVEILAESPSVADVTISPMTLAEDRAIGLAKFEDAHVVGTVKIPNVEVNAGERVTIELQIVNIGKTAATLGKIENLAVKGLELLAENKEISIEDHGMINLRGKRLEYLKTFDVKIPVRPRRKGTYEIRPRIIFNNDKGALESYDFDPVSVSVKEIGVLGWLRGPS